MHIQCFITIRSGLKGAEVFDTAGEAHVGASDSVTRITAFSLWISGKKSFLRDAAFRLLAEL